MPGDGQRPRSLGQFRGLHDLGEDDFKVPDGFAIRADNVTYLPSGVKSRPGFTEVGTVPAPVVSMKEWVSLDLATRRLLVLTTAGSLYKENNRDYTFSLVAAGIVESSLGASLTAESATAFGKEYFAFAAAGLGAIGRPMQFDDTNFDPIAPGGCGAAPTVAAAAGGSIVVGDHYFRVCFLTRSGYLTQPGPAFLLNFAGSNLTASVSSLPLGPAWVVARVIVMSPESNPGDFFYVPNTGMVVNDNTSTTTTFSVTDIVLTSSVGVSTVNDPDEDRLAMIALPSQSSVVFYNGRLVTVGERRTYTRTFDSGPINMGFDGGFQGADPTGWFSLLAGHAKATGAPDGGVGDALQITGDGAGQKGCLQNNAALAEFIDPGVSIRFRARMAKSAGAGTTAVCRFYVALSTDGFGTVPAGFDVSANVLSSTEYRWIDGEILTPAANVMVALSRLRLCQTPGNPLPNNEKFFIDDMEIYPAAEGTSPSMGRVSRADAPEDFSDEDGIVLVSENDGERLNGAFVLGSSLYWWKDLSLHASYDDGSGEPGSWPVRRISETVGSRSRHGVGRGDGWVVIAGRSGCWLFDGADYINLAEPIHKTWAALNWLYGYLFSVDVDTNTRRVRVAAVPAGGTKATLCLSLDYVGKSPADTCNISKWTVADAPAFKAMAQSERPDGTRAALFATDHSTGKILTIDKAAVNDYSAQPIASAYRTCYIGNETGRSLFDYWAARVSGTGTINMLAYDPSGQAIPQALAGPLNKPLELVPVRDVEGALDARNDKIAFEFLQNTLGYSFSLTRLALYVGTPATGFTGGAQIG